MAKPKAITRNPNLPEEFYAQYDALSALCHLLKNHTSPDVVLVVSLIDPIRSRMGALCEQFERETEGAKAAS
jgi:hypothetical protein